MSGGFGGGGYQADNPKAPTHYVRIYNTAGVIVRQFGPMDETRAGMMKSGLEAKEDHTQFRVEIEEKTDADTDQEGRGVDHDRGFGGAESPGDHKPSGPAGDHGAENDHGSSERDL